MGEKESETYLKKRKIQVEKNLLTTSSAQSKMAAHIWGREPSK